MANFPITANDRRAGPYTAIAAQTVFPYDFPLYADSEIAVYRTRAGVTTLLTLNSDYTVGGIGAQAGGTVTLTAGAAAGDIITNVGDMPNARATDFQEGGDFRAETVNLELDRLTIQIQELVAQVARLVGLAPFSTFVGSLVLPEPGAGLFLRWNAGGNALETAAVVPASSVVSASEIAQGIAEIATQAETDAGVDDARIVTPAKLVQHEINAGLSPGARLFLATACI